MIEIKIKLKDIVYYDLAAEFGLNPWCLNEGADGESWIECELTNYIWEVMNNIKRRINK